MSSRRLTSRSPSPANTDRSCRPPSRETAEAALMRRLETSFDVRDSSPTTTLVHTLVHEDTVRSYNRDGVVCK